MFSMDILDESLFFILIYFKYVFCSMFSYPPPSFNNSHLLRQINCAGQAVITQSINANVRMVKLVNFVCCSWVSGYLNVFLVCWNSWTWITSNRTVWSTLQRYICLAKTILGFVEDCNILQMRFYFKIRCWKTRGLYWTRIHWMVIDIRLNDLR